MVPRLGNNLMSMIQNYNREGTVITNQLLSYCKCPKGRLKNYSDTLVFILLLYYVHYADVTSGRN